MELGLDVGWLPGVAGRQLGAPPRRRRPACNKYMEFWMSISIIADAFMYHVGAPMSKTIIVSILVLSLGRWAEGSSFSWNTGCGHSKVPSTPVLTTPCGMDGAKCSAI